MTSGKMKAVVKTRPAEGAELIQMEIPRVEKDWVLCKVLATSICGSDVHIYNWDAWSANRVGEGNLPRILGHEVAGEVVEVGDQVRDVKVGDMISAETHIYDPADLTARLGQHHIGRNMQIISLDTQGAFAEYVAVPERVCWKNGPDMPPELATIQEPLGNALYALLGEDADVAGKTLAIIGDGPIALFACALARVVGLAKIFVTGLSPVSLEIAKKVGADQALLVKPPNGDHVEEILAHTDGWGCDIVLDMTGTQPGLDDCFKVLRKGGRFSAFGVSAQERVTLDYNEGIVFKACQIHGINGRRIFDTWYRVSNLLKTGRLDVYPILTHMLPLAEFAKGFDLAREEPRRCSKVILFPDEKELEKAKARATGLLG